MGETIHPRGDAGGRGRQVDGQQHEGAAWPADLDDCLSVSRLGQCAQRCSGEHECAALGEVGHWVEGAVREQLGPRVSQRLVLAVQQARTTTTSGWARSATEARSVMPGETHDQVHLEEGGRLRLSRLGLVGVGQ